MALLDMTSSGSNSYVAALFDQGYSVAVIRQRVQERWPQASARDVRTAIEYGRRAWSAGVQMTVGGEDTLIPASAIPRAGGAGTRFSYTVRLEVIEPTLGGGQQSIGYRQFEVVSATNLIRGDVVDQAVRAAELMYRDVGSGTDDAPTAAGWWVGDVEILAIERV